MWSTNAILGLFYWFLPQVTKLAEGECGNKSFVTCVVAQKIIIIIIIQSKLHVWPPLVSEHLPLETANPKHQNFPSQSITVGTSSKWPPPASDCGHFLCLTVHDFPLFFLTSCKQPLDAFSDLYVCCVHYATKNIWRTLVTMWNYTWRNLDIASQ